MNRRAKEPLFLTFSPPAGRRNQRWHTIPRFWGSMRQFFGGNLSPTLSPHAGREGKAPPRLQNYLMRSSPNRF